MRHFLLLLGITFFFHVEVSAKTCDIDENLDDFSILRFYEEKCSNTGVYNNQERSYRQSILRRSLSKIRPHNARFRKRVETFKMGLNKFSDKSEEEMKSMRGLNIGTSSNRLKRQSYPSSIYPGGYVDLRSTGCIRDVGNQDMCASCYAWAASYVNDASRCLQCGTPLEASSIQDIVDCSSYFGNFGCNGGNIKNSVNFTKYYASARDSDYPYKGTTGFCRRPSNIIINKNLVQYFELPKGNETAMLQIIKRNPLAVGIKASGPEIIYYTGGVISGPSCYAKESDVDHAVLVVGYGTDWATGRPYWLLQNFWDKDWGENGLFRLEMGTNCLGIAVMPSYVSFGC